MYISDATVDDVLRRVLVKLLSSKTRIKPTRGPATELIGVLLQVTNPRARISRTEMKGKLFSCLGELIWYLAKTKDLRFIAYYLSHYAKDSEDGRTVYGGYGPRLFNMKNNDQVANVIALLRNNPDSRRAVIQLFDAADIAKRRKEIPCTCVLQFRIRHQRLHMLTYMRSNDAFLGLSHDVFAFTMLQEIMARTLCVELGTYKHMIGSLHLYENNTASARKYVDEGWQSTTLPMPPMPVGDPWSSIRKVVRAEREIRLSGTVDVCDLNLDNYWMDLIHLLQIYCYFKQRDDRMIAGLRKLMSSRVYDIYIDQKRQSALKNAKKPTPKDGE